jgi:hypothetical protein
MYVAIGIVSDCCAEGPLEPLPRLGLEFGANVPDEAAIVHSFLKSVDVLWMQEQPPSIESQKLFSCVSEEIESAFVDLAHGTVTSGTVDCITRYFGQTATFVLCVQECPLRTARLLDISSNYEQIIAIAKKPL